MAEEGYIFHGENKTATFPYKHLKGNDTYCQSQCDNDTSCNGFSINTSNSDCFISACDTPITIISCFTCYFASKNPPSSDVVCPLNHTTTFTQPTTMAEFNTKMSNQTTETQRTPIKQSATLTQEINFEQSFTVTQQRSSEENTTGSQEPSDEQATIVKQLSSLEQSTPVTQETPFEQPTTVANYPPSEQTTTKKPQPTYEQPSSEAQQLPLEQSITVTLLPTNEQHSTVTEPRPTERPSTVTQQPSMERPTTVTQQPSIEHPTNVTAQSLTGKSITATQMYAYQRPTTVAQQPSIEQPTNVTEQSLTGQPTTVTQKYAYERPTTVTQQPTIEQPVTSTYHHTEQPTKRSTLDQSTTVTQNSITQGSTMEQFSNITMTHHLDTTRTISSTPVTSFKQWLTYTGFTCIESTTNANSVDEVINNYETIFATNNSHCVCICKTVDITLEESIERRRKGLIVNKTGLSSNIRKLTSAKDFRVTSQTIGTVAIIIMTVVGVLFFSADIGVAVCMRASKMTEKSTAIKPS